MRDDEFEELDFFTHGTRTVRLYRHRKFSDIARLTYHNGEVMERVRPLPLGQIDSVRATYGYFSNWMLLKMDNKIAENIKAMWSLANGANSRHSQFSDKIREDREAAEALSSNPTWGMF